MRSGAFTSLAVCLIMGITGSGFRQKLAGISFLPLGDSYTICTGARIGESWPVLLTRHLKEKGMNCSLAENPAKNGYTTKDLIDHELPLCRKLKPDFVTLLIGVNDWVQGVSREDFKRNLVYILNEIKGNMGPRGRILLMTIPDFGVTPEGKNYSGGRNISKGISEFNDIIKSEAAQRKLDVVDLFELSKKMGEDPSLIAADGLHPSAKEYAIWEKHILPAVLKLW